MAKDQELVQVTAEDWVSLTGGTVTWVTFQIKNIQYQSDSLIVRTGVTKPADTVMLGWDYKEEEGEISRNLAAFGAGGQLWGRALRGGVAVLVTTG